MNIEIAGKAITFHGMITDKMARHLAKQCEKDGRISVDRLDEHQIAANDFAFRVAERKAAEAAIAALNAQKQKGMGVELEETLTHIFVAETFYNLLNTCYKRLSEYGLKPGDLEAAEKDADLMAFAESGLAAQTYEKAAELMLAGRQQGASLWLGEEHTMFRDSFRKFANDKVKPLAEKVHRQDLLIPKDIIRELAGMGCFGLSLPQKYGGFQDDNKPDNTGMVVVTEELSRASLGIAGSLITRPEILAKALLKGGTEEQKKTWLPKMATGEKMVAVAVTEPDFGSDVAGMKLSATKKDGGWVLNGTKTWCTFAGYADLLMVLARTDPDLSLKHKGLSIFIVEKPRFEGHEFSYSQAGQTGKISGRAIGTIGYRGMHSFEVFFDNYFVPQDNLVGGEAGLGKGFYLQMAGFAAGRLQTAGRALGVMQAAFEEAMRYAADRKVFGRPVSEYQLSRYKLARMAALIHANRQFSYAVARLMDAGKGELEASMVKIYASRMAEWVTREAMQLHGGMGYAEEFPVSRYFVDARVFSIFEGAEEVLVLRVVARQLLEKMLRH